MGGKAPKIKLKPHLEPSGDMGKPVATDGVPIGFHFQLLHFSRLISSLVLLLLFYCLTYKT